MLRNGVLVKIRVHRNRFQFSYTRTGYNVDLMLNELSGLLNTLKFSVFDIGISQKLTILNYWIGWRKTSKFEKNINESVFLNGSNC